VRVFEIDQPDVLEYKATSATRRRGASGSCRWICVKTAAALRAAGFGVAAPALWLVEGLLAVSHGAGRPFGFSPVSDFAAPESEVSSTSRATRCSRRRMKERLEFVASLGTVALLDRCAEGSSSRSAGTVVQSAVIGNRHGHYFPRSRAVRRRPPGFLVHGRKPGG
jgi:hypothetical protein